MWLEGSRKDSIKGKWMSMFIKDTIIRIETNRWEHRPDRVFGGRRKLICLEASRFLAMHGHSQRFRILGDALEN